MRRTNFLLALIALLASTLFAGSALAHGPNRHAVHQIAPAAASIPNPGEATGATPKDALVWIVASHFEGTQDDCPGNEAGCCASHCCPSAGLGIDAPGSAPAFAARAMPLPSERPPADAGPGTQLRPPCR